MSEQQKDNSTFRQKAALRRVALKRLADLGVSAPVVLETHGGSGRLFDACYAHLDSGAVFEKDPTKSARLGRQRPTWAVYEADCIEALAAGAGRHLQIDLLDVDPYGDCWPVLDAFLTSDRPFAPVMALAVNDGLRQKLAIGAWDVASMQDMVLRYGNKLHDRYLEICLELLEEKAARAGYDVDHFAGYYTGHGKNMTHFLAVLRRL